MSLHFFKSGLFIFCVAQLHFIQGQPEQIGCFRDAVDQVLRLYDRDVTVLEIGLSDELLSFDIASSFSNSTCVMMCGSHDSDTYVNEVQALCVQKALDNIIFLSNKSNADVVQRLADCEHFDVVIVSDIESYFGNNWKTVLGAILDLGDHIIIEYSSTTKMDLNELSTVLHECVRRSKNKLTLEMKSEASCFLIKGQRKSLRRAYWISYPRDFYRIESTYNTKYLYNLAINRTTTWEKGINLTTFYIFGGLYPSADFIKSKVQTFAQLKDGDFAIWNMIIQGKDIVLIDQDDPRWAIESKGALELFFRLWNTSLVPSTDALWSYHDEIQKIVSI